MKHQVGDIVMGFGYQEEAERLPGRLVERPATFALAQQSDKTQLEKFGRIAIKSRQRQGKRRPETFTFLGFAYICAHTCKGAVTMLRQTITRRPRNNGGIVGGSQTSHASPGRGIGALAAPPRTGFFDYHRVP